MPANLPDFIPIHGYAALFGKPDAARDMIAAGAFTRSLTRRPAGLVRMLYQHDPAEVIGLWHDLRPDRYGLYVAGGLIPSAPRVQGLVDLIRCGALDGLSIGYRTVRSGRGHASGTRILHEIDLWEISIVTFPMMPNARIHLRVPPRKRLAQPETGLSPSLGSVPSSR